MLKVFVGWDPKDETAAKVCEKSIRKHSTVPVEIHFLKDHELRKRGFYWRPYRMDERGQMWDDRFPMSLSPLSTHFSITRFIVPSLESHKGDYCVYMDADFMFRGDIGEMMSLCTDDKAVWCVKHDHNPTEEKKMDGVVQTRYLRKNWSSLMIFAPWRCRLLDKHAVNNWKGLDLHAFKWTPDETIGALPQEWNWLEGWSDPSIDPKAVHFTRGTPDMLDDLPYADEWRSYL